MRTLDDVMRDAAWSDIVPRLTCLAASVLITGEWIWVDEQRFEELVSGPEAQYLSVSELLSRAVVRTKENERPHPRCRLLIGWKPVVMV